MAMTKIPTHYIAASLIVPTVVMMSGRFMGQGASQAQAVTITPLAAVQSLPDGAVDLIRDQKTIVKSSNVRSPFYFEEEQEGIFSNPMDLIEDQSTYTQQIEMPDCKLTSILPHKTRPLAIINAKPYRIGDVVFDGWKLIEIDGDSRTIVIKHIDGRKLTVGLAQEP